MPTQSKTICSYPGCNTLVIKGRCSRHPYPKKKRTNRKANLYNSNWRQVRVKVLRRAPLCQYRIKCKGAPSTEVDHRDNDQRNNDRSNLVACCKRCHSYKTATEDTGRNERGQFQ